VDLDQALGRLPVRSLKSTLPKPSFDQSTRDGYAVNESGNVESDGVTFSLVAEVAAGSLAAVSIQPGEAARIMTGARIPSGCTRVVPFEQCRENGQMISVPAQCRRTREKFIRHCGKDLPVGRVIAGHGERLLPDNLLMLAENRRMTVEVYGQPEVVVLCTGSELVNPGQQMQEGQKISGNGVLLQALIQEVGGICLRTQTATDSSDEIIARLEKMIALKPNMIVTTGGMGPGKFDLLEQVFSRLGGQVLYNRLQVRPGKSTLYGHLAGVPLFALPGPPPAVRLLFHELVAPALYKLQGMRNPLTALVKARLLEPLSAGKSKHLSLKNGVAVLKEATLFVRPAGRQDAVNAVLYLNGEKSSFAVGELVPVHLIRSFAEGSLKN
jgi:molybdopterin molybdotransferase